MDIFKKNISDFSSLIACMARDSLIMEVCTTPKPGLVDMANSGAHKDMDIHTFLNSAHALYPYFYKCTQAGAQPDSCIKTLFPTLRPLGIQAEQEMYQATNGVNTHKGALFAMGIFCGAAGLLWKKGTAFGICRQCPDLCVCNGENNPEILSFLDSFSFTCKNICQGLLSDFEHLSPELSLSNGEKLFQEYKLTGIRGEAVSGFPTVFTFGYPIYNNYRREGLSRNEAGLCTLLHLIATVPDTNFISRSSLQTLLHIQKDLKAFLSSATPQDILQVLPRLDEAFIQANISPGGCADMLALIYFVDMLLGIW